ncbi:hypothetical protein H2203_003010 [Taxawa tesnikishii (nom. ined.)]|nr:hypothetical protein H2203_003010 [Dothideales sp. JES 119]
MLALALTAELNGVTDLLPEDTEDNPFYYTFKRRGELCVALQELQGLPESVVAIKDKCLNRYQREHSANIKEAPRAYQQNEPAKKQNIIEIDCRGLEFTEFIPRYVPM